MSSGWVPVTWQGMQPDDSFSCGLETERRGCGFSEGWGCRADYMIAVQIAASEALLPSTLVNHPSKLWNSFGLGNKWLGDGRGLSGKGGRKDDTQTVCAYPLFSCRKWSWIMKHQLLQVIQSPASLILAVSLSAPNQLWIEPLTFVSLGFFFRPCEWFVHLEAQSGRYS